MRLLPVVAVRPSLSRLLLLACVQLGLLVSPALLVAQNQSPLLEGGYLARINNDSPEEVADALRRAQMLYEQGGFPQGADPIAIVLHGPEVEVFFKDKYDNYKGIVDLAESLSESGIVEVRVCETQTGILGRHKSSLHSFIGTVPFGPTEVNRLLLEQSYSYF